MDYLGIDWGTQSSKWALQTESGNTVIGPIWDSSVSRIGEKLFMSTMDERFNDPSKEIALKRKLIQDPDQSFWEGTRPKLGVTLGEAVVFSILTLLLDAHRNQATKGRNIVSQDLTIRFSHPNWITADNVRALGCFRDAAVAAMRIFLAGIKYVQNSRSIMVKLADLREAVQFHRSVAGNPPMFPTDYSHDEYLKGSRGSIGSTMWELVFESCAAGFPYLLQGDRQTFDGDLRKFPANKRIRKILVVDVGAGSTDAGYMVRTVRPRDAKGLMKPLLIWVPAADALEIAGRWLTDKILNDFKQQGRRDTAVEAEEYKINNRNWYSKPYVREWTTLIGDHVKEYASGIRDDICLPNKPELEVILTGGSSVVAPLKEIVLQDVKTALKHRGLGVSAKLMGLVQPETHGRSYREVEVAQLAVSLGASDPRLAELKAYPEGLLGAPFAATV